MDALSLLTGRASSVRLLEPAPAGAALDAIFTAAAQAPDHARLQPWRLLAISGTGRDQLGELFETALLARDSNATEQQRDKARNAPLRAPLVVAVVVRLREHPKVPAIEQWLSAGCVAHAMLLAAQAQGFGGVWRTGEPNYDPQVMRGLGLTADEALVGFIYLGTPATPRATPAKVPPVDFVANWPA